MTNDGDPDSTAKTDWDGYSDYKTVSKNIVEATQNAITAFAELESRHAEGARVKPTMAARARMHIKAAALQLLPELQRNSDSNEEYEKILARWTGGSDDADDDDDDDRPQLPASDGGTVQPERQDADDGAGYEYSPRDSDNDDTEGYLDRLSTVTLHEECPGWLEQFVLDIKMAGFELGYLQAGRSVSVNDDPGVDEDVNEMFDGLDINS